MSAFAPASQYPVLKRLTLVGAKQVKLSYPGTAQAFQMCKSFQQIIVMGSQPWSLGFVKLRSYRICEELSWILTDFLKMWGWWWWSLP